MQLKFVVAWLPALAFLLCCSLPASSDTISVKTMETILHTVHSAELKDVVNRQFLYTLFNNRNDRLQFVKLHEAVSTHVLFVTVVPCTSPMEVEFTTQRMFTRGEARMKSTTVNDHLLSTNKADSPDWDPTDYMSSRSVTYKLDISYLSQLGLRLKLFTPTKFASNRRSSPAERANVKSIIKISNRYPDIELGDSRYNVLVCAPNPDTQPEMLSVRFYSFHNAPDYLSDCLVCVVINLVRPLREFCAAQVALSNRLPFAQDRLLYGGGLENLTLRVGDFAYDCKPQGSEIPVVNISQLLCADPSVLFVNVFLVKPPKESGAQPEAISWETIRYYRRDPADNKILAPVSCKSSGLARRGRTPLIEVSPGKFRAELSIPFPPEASLLVRPSRLDLVGSAYNVQLAPLSGQSNSFEHQAQSHELSCSDSVWGYGGVLCGKYQRKSCLPGDKEACRFDRVRVSIRLDHKYQRSDRLTDRQRLSYSNPTKLLAEPREVQWYILLPSRRNEYTVLQPSIGRVAEAKQMLTDIAYFSRDTSAFHSTEMFKIIRDCDVALKDGLVSETSEALIRRATNCYRRLLEICTHVNIQCRNPDHPLIIEIASPATTMSVPVFSPGGNVYYCFVFEAELQETQIARNREELDVTEQWLRTRLLQSVSTIDFPTAENQGFGSGSNSEANTDKSGGRKIVSFKRVYARGSPLGDKHPFFVPKISEKWLRWLRYFVIYVYAAPNTKHLLQRPSLASLRVVSYNTTQARSCKKGEKIHVQGVEDP